MPLQVKKAQLKLKEGNEYLDGDLLFNVDAQAWARGYRNGSQIVDTNDPAYHNNALYYRDQAAASATAAATAALTGNLAPVFATNTAYAVGDYVIYNDGTSNTLYRFTTAHAAGAWTGNDVEAIMVNQVLNEVEDATDNAIVVNKPATDDTKIKIDTTDEDVDLATMEDLDAYVTRPIDDPNGTNGQLLRTKGNGETEWIDQGTPTQAQIQDAVDVWMEENPTDRALIDDGMITEAKLSDELKLLTIKDYVTPEMFGAVGNGTFDDTNAINQAISYCVNNNYKLVTIPNKRYKITSSINMRGIRHIESYGIIDNGDNEIVIGSTNLVGNPDNYYFNQVNGKIKLMGGSNATIRIDYAVTLILFADGNDNSGSYIGYCSFYLGYIRDLIINSASGNRTPWVNDNKFFGAHLVNVTIDGEGGNNPNNNIFYGPKIEGETILINKGYSNAFYDCRFESTVSIVLGESTFNNRIECNWDQMSNGIFSDVFQFPTNVKAKITDNGKNNFVVTSYDAFTKKETIYSLNSLSNNFDVSLITKNRDNLTLQQNKYILETELIPLRNPFALYFESDQSNFRAELYCYNAQKETITTEPTEAIYAPNKTWNSTNGYYSNATGFGKRNNNAGVLGFYPNKGVAFVKLKIKTVNYTPDSWDIEYFNIVKIENQRFNTQISLPSKYKKYISPSAPDSGVWDMGDIVYKSSPASNGPIGWVCISAGNFSTNPPVFKEFGTIGT